MENRNWDSRFGLVCSGLWWYIQICVKSPVGLKWIRHVKPKKRILNAFFVVGLLSGNHIGGFLYQHVFRRNHIFTSILRAQIVTQKRKILRKFSLWLVLIRHLYACLDLFRLKRGARWLIDRFKDTKIWCLDWFFWSAHNGHNCFCPKVFYFF